MLRVAEPSGHGLPVVILLAMSIESVLFPAAGSPMISDNFPIANRLGQSQSIDSSSTSLSVTYLARLPDLPFAVDTGERRFPSASAFRSSLADADCRTARRSLLPADGERSSSTSAAARFEQSLFVVEIEQPTSVPHQPTAVERDAVNQRVKLSGTNSDCRLARAGDGHRRSTRRHARTAHRHRYAR